jgi:hypothetical protein
MQGLLGLGLGSVFDCLCVAGYFLVRPSKCTKCNSSNIGSTPVKTHAMDYITKGVHPHVLLVFALPYALRVGCLRCSC